MAVLLGGAAVPQFSALAARSRGAGAMFELHALLGLARQAAVSHAEETTLCGTTDDVTCSNEWSTTRAVAFVDRNQNRRLDAAEVLLGVASPGKAGRIRWRASGGRDYLRFRPDGGVREYGTFVHCPQDERPEAARAVIVAATGRARAASDANRNGVVEDGSGADVSCAP